MQISFFNDFHKLKLSTDVAKIDNASNEKVKSALKISASPISYLLFPSRLFSLSPFRKLVN